MPNFFAKFGLVRGQNRARKSLLFMTYVFCSIWWTLFTTNHFESSERRILFGNFPTLCGALKNYVVLSSILGFGFLAFIIPLFNLAPQKSLEWMRIFSMVTRNSGHIPRLML